jgi:hypothetical protein
MTPNLIAWLSAPESVEERRERIAEYLVNEGYELPSPPRAADYDEAGTTHRVRGQEMTVVYSVIDQQGRQVYHYLENEVDHIMINRIERGDDWMLENLTAIPTILRQGDIILETPDKVIYQSRRTYQDYQKRHHVFWLVLHRTRKRHWYIETFYPR